MSSLLEQGPAIGEPKARPDCRDLGRSGYADDTPLLHDLVRDAAEC